MADSAEERRLQRLRGDTGRVLDDAARRGAGADNASPPGFIGGFDEDFSVMVMRQEEDVRRQLRDEGVGFVQGIPRGNFTVEVTPRYFDDQEWNLFAGLSPERIRSVQIQMVNAGFLDPEDMQLGLGRWAQGEAGAMADIMAIANGNGMSWQQVLASGLQSAEFRAQFGGGGRGRGGGGGGGARPTIRISNADDLRLTFRNVARQVSGGVFIDGEQVDRMVEGYQQAERDFQNQVIAGAAEVEEAPSPDAFTVTQLEELDPQAIEGNRFAGMASVMQTLIEGGEV